MNNWSHVKSNVQIFSPNHCCRFTDGLAFIQCNTWSYIYVTWLWTHSFKLEWIELRTSFFQTLTSTTLLNKVKTRFGYFIGQSNTDYRSFSHEINHSCNFYETIIENWKHIEISFIYVLSFFVKTLNKFFRVEWLAIVLELCKTSQQCKYWVHPWGLMESCQLIKGSPQLDCQDKIPRIPLELLRTFTIKEKWMHLHFNGWPRIQKFCQSLTIVIDSKVQLVLWVGK